MKIKSILLLSLLLLVCSCYQNGYQPTYIISEEVPDDAVEQKTR